MAARSFIKNKP